MLGPARPHNTSYSGGHFMRVDHAWVDLSRNFYKKFYMHDARPPRRVQLYSRIL